VVNIITQQGADIDGIEAKVGIGNYGQMRGDLVFGKRYFDLDLLIWGSIYKNNGEKKDVSEESFNEDTSNMQQDHFTIGRIGNKPSHDIGIQLKWKDLQFFYDAQFSQIIAPFTISTLAKTYDWDRYKTFNGHSPSYSTESHHVDLSYSRQFEKLYLKGNIAYDNSDLSHYQVISDNSFEELGQLMGLDANDPNNIFIYPGLFRNISGQEQNYSFQLKGDYSYISSAHHNGNLSFGTEFSHFQLEDVRYALGYNFVMIAPENPLIPESGKGHENSYNAFLQLKHQWHSIILNAGLRFDHKKRADGRTLNEFSPRIAFILLQPKWNIKFSYSRSFVDAPYLYRKTNELLPLLSSERAGDDFSVLNPEFVNSLQLTFAGSEWAKGFNFEINGFYNRAQDLIMTHIIEHLNEAENKTIGIELMTSYRKPKFTADFNLTWTNTIKSNLFTMSIDANNNTPAITSNATLSWKPAPKLKLFSNIAFESKMTSYNINIVQLIRFQQLSSMIANLLEQQMTERAAEMIPLAQEAQEHIILKNDMKARAIFNIGAEYQLGKVTLGLNVRNLFNTQYNRSGMNTKLIPQKGRWFMFDVAYKF
jgi:iron complex outermembrane receptor protein